MRRRSQGLDEEPGDGAGPWEEVLARWMAPVLAALGHKGRQRWAPVYLPGLLGPDDRKSVQPIAASLAPEDHEQLHHFIATSACDPAPLASVLAHEAERGGSGCAANPAFPLDSMWHLRSEVRACKASTKSGEARI